MKKYLITGAAGFIGSQLMNRLKNQGHEVLGIDNFNNHLYEPKLKHDRVEHFDIDVRNLDLNEEKKLETIIDGYQPTHVVHLAAYAGVRDSYGKEREYHKNNIDATQTLINVCKRTVPDTRIVYASTSCVYAGSEVPWTEGKETGKQLNPYGWSKWTNECQFQASGLYNVGLRFFTVYGPWGRPDMALFTFTKKILDNKPISVYNYGDMKRDFTYVEDILDGIECVLNNDVESGEIFNIGRGQQVALMDFINEIENNVGKIAVKLLRPKHPADTLETWSNTDKLASLGYRPSTNIDVGVKEFYKWYKEYNGV
jgi:UDP-glucuronate 4-epimerase